MTESRSSPPRAARPSDITWLAVASTALAVVAHLTAVTIRGRVLHHFTWTSADLPWMSLAGNAIIFGCSAIAIWWIGALVPRLRQLPAMVAIFGCTTALCILLLITELWQYASLVLAVGVATALARATRQVPDTLMRGVRRAGVVCVTIALVAAGRSLAGPPSPPATSGVPNGDAPNVLFIILDTVRAASTSLYGYALKTTPVLDSIAQEGVVFDRAVATAPWTLPSHCSLFTGRDAEHTSCRWTKPLDGAPTTLAEVLRQRGYRTGGFVANHFYTTRETGLARGFDTWKDFQRTWKEVFCSTVIAQTGIVRNAVWGNTLRERFSGVLRLRLRGDPKPEHDRKDAATVNAEMLQWLDAGQGGGRPFFAFLNYFDAHDPYRAPSPFDTAFPKAPHDREQYDGAIRFMDQQVGALLQQLQQRGVLDRTIVVVASDHGELWGEHELYGHGNAVYWPLLHVPLFIRYPARLAGGAHVAQTVSLRDLPATILDLAAATDLRIAGVSLVGAAAGVGVDSIAVRPSPAVTFVERGENWWGKEPARFDSLRSITYGSYQLIRSFKGREALFDVASDSLGVRDLAASDSVGERRAFLRDALQRAMARPTIAVPATTSGPAK